MADEEEASKTEEATPKKLEEARKKGDVAKTADLSSVMSLFAVFGVIAIGGGYFMRRMTYDLLPFIEHPDAIDLQGGAWGSVARQAMGAAFVPLIAILATAAAAGLFGNLIQTGFLWSTSKLMPDFKKVSPGAGFKRIFGIDGLMEFVKSILKISVVGFVAWSVLKPRFAEMSGLSALSPAAILPEAGTVIKALFIAIVSLLAITAGADWLWQKYRFAQRMRMSKEEVKQDYKNTEGDPHIKAKLKQKRMEASRRRMIQAVPKATMVVMNPTHYAVALYYKAGETAAPKCVAKGLDALALKIRAIAEEHDVPVIEDPPLARALYAAIDVDDVIPPAHYEAVARIIGFIMNKAKGFGGGRPIRAGAL
jgi:flagellar biosynthetic protein FlhB